MKKLEQKHDLTHKRQWEQMEQVAVCTPKMEHTSPQVPMKIKQEPLDESTHNSSSASFPHNSYIGIAPDLEQDWHQAPMKLEPVESDVKSLSYGASNFTPLSCKQSSLPPSDPWLPEATTVCGFPCEAHDKILYLEEAEMVQATKAFTLDGYPEEPKLDWEEDMKQSPPAIHVTIKYTCSKCRRQFTDLTTFQAHPITQYNCRSLRFCCIACPAWFVNWMEFVEHNTSIHGCRCSMCCGAKNDLFPQIIKIVPTPIATNCERCEKYSENSSNDPTDVVENIQNESKHAQNNTQTCESELDLPKPSKRQRSLLQLVLCKPVSSDFKVVSLLHQILLAKSTNDKKRYRCTMCTNTFDQNMQVKEHMETHHTQADRHQCYWCGLTFISLLRLANHIKATHNSNRCWRCPVCDVCFFKHSEMELHIPYHLQHQARTEPTPEQLPTTSVYPPPKSTALQCTICGVCLFYDGHLIQHIKEKHKTEDKHRCFECPCLFSSILDLAEHVKIHRKDSLCECPVCSKTFCHLNSMKSHLQHHTHEPIFQCFICLKKFRNKNLLNSHRREHTGSIPKQFKCSLCKRKFSMEKIAEKCCHKKKTQKK